MLEKIAEKLSGMLEKWEDVLVVGHYDADGITATAITVKTLERMGKDVEFMCLKQLYREDVERINDKGKNVVFVDLGAGQLEYLVQKMEFPFVVLDHHKSTVPQYPFVFHPSLAGLDGGKDISGAGMAYLLKRFPDLAKLAVIGASGDMQKMEGVNEEILKDAVREGDIVASKDLALYGRSSRPVYLMLEYSSNPVLPGLTANKEECLKIVKKAGVDPKKAYVFLSGEERKKLFTELFVFLSKQGWSEKKIWRLVGDVYELVREEKGSPTYDVREFATMLNATGRHGKPEIGVHVCLGDRGKYFRKCLSLLSKHRQVLKKGIEWVLDGRLEEREKLLFFHARNKIPPEVVGIVAGMVYGSGYFGYTKPILGFAYEGEMVKVSARASGWLVKKGLDLAEVMRVAAKAVGGESGGHKPAAGARIPKGSEEEFLKVFERELEKLF